MIVNEHYHGIHDNADDDNDDADDDDDDDDDAVVTAVQTQILHFEVRRL